MISCLFHQITLRRHLDEGRPLSVSARSHLDACPRCREMFATHTKVVGQLKRQNTEHIATPPFLHTRLMAAIRSESAPRRSSVGILPRVAATAAVAIVAIFVSINAFQPRKDAAINRPLMPLQIAFKATLPENPLEKEIQNLQADTVNAAKALAATFLPAESLGANN